MSGLEFFDSNLLCYTDDAGDATRRRLALDVWQRSRKAGRAVVSVQVLQEYYAVVTRKLGVDPVIAIEKLRLFKRAHVIVPDANDVIDAARLGVEHKLSFWDAMIVTAALKSDCVRLYSEDLQRGRRFGGLQIVNPFTEERG